MIDLLKSKVFRCSYCESELEVKESLIHYLGNIPTLIAPCTECLIPKKVHKEKIEEAEETARDEGYEDGQDSMLNECYTEEQYNEACTDNYKDGYDQGRADAEKEMKNESET